MSDPIRTSLGTLFVAGEHIKAETPVVVSLIDNKLYAAGEHAGTYIADAVEDIREGFRCLVSGSEVKEDDA